jgi:tetratricopeptide (TPR) repeat protein
LASFNRNETIRNAEKLLRAGKVEAAIAEYLRVLADQPTDWSTANTLGDLYARAGQVDKAVERFVEIADTLNAEGQRVKAAAVYKKIVKLKPDHEHALMQAAELAAGQGLFADARAYLNTVIEKRRAAGDQRGAAQARVMLGGIDPADFSARIEGARARLDVNDAAGAVRDLCAIASELSEATRYAEAIDALREAAALQPDDESVRGQLFEIYSSTDDFERAAEQATTAAQFKSLAESLALRERPLQAIEMQQRAVSLDPADTDLRRTLAHALLERGDMKGAGEYMSAEIAGTNPALLMTLAEIQFRGGKTDDGMAVLRQLLAEDPARSDEIVALASKVAASSPEAGFLMVEVAAEASVAASQWESAAAAIEVYVTQVPTYVPALMRLVEICVDGGLEPAMYDAQARLADAYLAAGAVADARFIAEDLVAREPWELSHIQRFRRTLELLGEADPDGIIAERLSGQSPFTSTDLMAEDAAAAAAAAEQARLQAEADAELMARTLAMLAEVEGDEDHEPAGAEAGEDDEHHDEPEPVVPPPPRPAEHAAHFELSSNAIDLKSIFDEFEAGAPPAPTPRAKKKARRTKSKAAGNQPGVEVDLSVELAGMKPQSVVVPGPAAEPEPEQEPEPPEPEPTEPVGNDIDSIFKKMRSEASRRSTGDGAEAQLKRGLALRREGRIDECIEAFAIASRSPRHRFTASSLIGRLYRERDQLHEAIEWFERAAQAPASTADDGFILMYELADALEAAGEVSRALAVCMELQANAGEFRDVAERVDRLAKVQTEG